MNRITLANEVREVLGKKLVRHDYYGSRFNYSKYPSSTQVNPDKIAIHYYGASSQLGQFDGTLAADAAFMRGTDWLHYNTTRNWAHGFAYGFAVLPSGRIGEGRSFWYPWGAHPGDQDADGVSENLETIPILFPVGINDGDPLLWPSGLWDAAELLIGTLQDLCDLDLKAFLGHKDINKTSCPGQLYPYVQKWRTKGFFHPLTAPTPIPEPPSAPPTEEGGILNKLPRLKRSWPEDRTSYVTVKRAQALLAVAGEVASNTFDENHSPDGLFGPGTEEAVKSFQRKQDLIPDGVIGKMTWAELLGVGQ